jgi:hypothetical protein
VLINALNDNRINLFSYCPNGSMRKLAPNAAQTRLCPRPKFMDTRDIGSGNRVGQRPGADAVNVAAIIDEPAGRLDGLLRACVSSDAVRGVFVSTVLYVPTHSIA